MKGLVVYYSATGNTRKIARAIHRGMKDSMEDCDIATIKEMDSRNITDYDVIGVGSPIWWYRETANLRLFIYNLPQLEGKLCFPFCVHGAAPAGFMFSLVPLLKRKGLTIIGYNDWYGSVYQVRHMPTPYLTDGHPDEIDIKEAENWGREMVERARRILAGEKDLIPEIPHGSQADRLWHPPRRRPQPSDQDGGGQERRPLPQTQRTINMEKCRYPECTVCVDNCSVSSIDFSNSPPVIKQNCINCSLCNKLCPVGAIKVSGQGLESTTRRINMEKCTYPECTLCVKHCPMGAIDFSVTPPVFKWCCEGDDLCAAICPTGAIEVDDEAANMRIGIKDPSHPFVKFLEEAEAQGSFRRLVKLEDVGWDNPIYKITKHPLIVLEED